MDTCWSAIKTAASIHPADPARLGNIKTIGVGEHIWRPSKISSTNKAVTVMVDLTRDEHRYLRARLLDAVQGRSGGSTPTGWPTRASRASTSTNFVRSIYHAESPAAGRTIAEKVLDSLHTFPIPEVKRLGKNLRRWREEILAYFTTGGVSNGGTEAINGVIEKTRRLARGFRNFSNYRIRILLTADGSRPLPKSPHDKNRTMLKWEGQILSVSCGFGRAGQTTDQGRRILPGMKRSEVLRVTRDFVARRPAVQRLMTRGTRKGWIPSSVARRIPPDGLHRFRSTGGRDISYLANIDDWVGRGLIWDNAWEETSRAAFFQRLRGARVVMDVGAFTGVYALSAASDSAAQVIAVEPNPAILERLIENVFANGWQHRIEVHGKAVSDCLGVAGLSVPSNDPSCARLVSDASAGLQVNTITIDALANGRPVDLIKMDVEGHELAALRGASETLSRFGPSLLIELLDEDAFNSVSSLLAGAGYDTTLHVSSHGEQQVDNFVYEPYHSNFIFERLSTARR